MNPEIVTMLGRAASLPYGPSQVSATEEAERMARQEDDVTMFHVQLALCNAYTFAGKGERAMVAFSYCLSKLDEMRPEFIGHLHSILWRYKFVMASITNFPDMKVEQIEAALQDYRRRLKEAGHSERTYLYMRASVRSSMGFSQEVRSTLYKILAMRRDSQSDCRACEQCFEAETHFELQDWKGTLERGAAIMTGSSKCASVPGRALGYLAVACWREGLEEKAENLLSWGLRITEGNPVYLSATGYYMEALARLKQFELGLRILETRISWVLDTFEICRKILFFARTALFLDASIKRNGEFKVKMPYLPIGCKSDSATDVRDWLAADAMSLAKRFDVRNQNGFYVEHVTRILSGV